MLHVRCRLRAGFEIKTNLWCTWWLYFLLQKSSRGIFSFFLCGALWKLGKCEKWSAMGRWQIRMINLKSTIINTKAIHFEKQLSNNEIV